MYLTQTSHHKYIIYWPKPEHMSRNNNPIAPKETTW